jgi:glutamate/tyrosine decarboxylase-like PLP-dependent enzyme
MSKPKSKTKYLLSHWIVIISNTTRRIPIIGYFLNRVTVVERLKGALAKDASDLYQQRQLKQKTHHQRIAQKSAQHQEILQRLRTIQEQYEARTSHGPKSMSNPMVVSKPPLSSQLEAEIIKKCTETYHGTRETCGMVTGSTIDSIIRIFKTYRDFATEKLKVYSPEFIVSPSVHDNFLKVACDFNVRLVTIPLDPKTQTMDLVAVEKMIASNPNIALIVASVPSVATGNIDPVQALSEIALRRQIGLHVDAGGSSLLLAHAADIELVLPPSDFAVSGVTSMTISTNKDGKPDDGPTVLLFRTSEFAQYHPKFDSTWSWSAPNQSHPENEIAKAWASVVYRESSKSAEIARHLLALKDNLVNGMKAIEGIEVMGSPKLGIIAVTSRTLNPHLIVKKMKEKGWPLNYIYNPKGFNLCLTAEDITKFDSQKFLEQLAESVQHVKAHPYEQFMGNVVLYGMLCSKPSTKNFMLDTLEGEYTSPDQTRKTRAAAAVA